MIKNALILTSFLFSGVALADGASDYAAMCSACHGASGAGDGAAAAALDPKPADFTAAAFWAGKTDDHLKKVVKEGGAAVGKSPLMAGFGASMSDDQIAAVVAYIKTLKK